LSGDNKKQRTATQPRQPALAKAEILDRAKVLLNPAQTSCQCALAPVKQSLWPLLPDALEKTGTGTPHVVFIYVDRSRSGSIERAGSAFERAPGAAQGEHPGGLKLSVGSGQLMQYRTRDLLIRRLAQLSNALRAHLSEPGIAAARRCEGVAPTNWPNNKAVCGAA